MQFVQQALIDLTKCKTPADYYRVQIEISKHAAPKDVAILSNRPLPWPDEFDRWLSGLVTLATAVRTEPVAYQRQELDNTTALYSGGTRAANIVIAFTGKAGLLFMPIAAILQYFSPADFDFLLVNEAFKDDLRADGIRNSFSEMVARLGAAVGLTRYREVRTFGTSAGGAAALAAGVLTGATRAVTFSGHLPSSGVSYRGQASVAEIEEILRGAKPATRFAAVYAEGNKFDRRNALALSRFLPLHHYPIAGVNNHNIVYALHQRKELQKVFSDVGIV
jgi:hypothetical protein